MLTHWSIEEYFEINKFKKYYYCTASFGLLDLLQAVYVSFEMDQSFRQISIMWNNYKHIKKI